MKNVLLLFLLSTGLSAFAQSSAGTCQNPPCAPAEFKGIDPHSGQAELICHNENGYNCAQLATASGMKVPTQRFTEGDPGTVVFDGRNGKPVTMSFKSFRSIEKKGKMSIITFDGARMK